jgi:hypothetical protein
MASNLIDLILGFQPCGSKEREPSLACLLLVAAIILRMMLEKAWIKTWDLI